MLRTQGAQECIIIKTAEGSKHVRIRINQFCINMFFVLPLDHPNNYFLN